MPSPKLTPQGRLKNTKPPMQYRSLVRVDEKAYSYADLAARTGKTYKALQQRICVLRSRGKVTWALLGFPEGEPPVMGVKPT